MAETKNKPGQPYRIIPPRLCPSLFPGPPERKDELELVCGWSYCYYSRYCILLGTFVIY